MAHEDSNKNERMALLLGWERYQARDFDGYDLEAREVWKTVNGWKFEPGDGEYHYSSKCPDYTQWARFPEMQEYVRGLEVDAPEAAVAICERAAEITGAHPEHTAIHITPAILGDAIDEVMCKA